MADAVAPQGEATPSNTNVEDQPTQSSQPTEAAPASDKQTTQSIFSPEEAAEIKDFLDNNGGLKKVRQTISARKTDLANNQTQTQNDDKAENMPSQPPAEPQSQQLAQPNTPAKGFLKPSEIIAKTYNSQLESDPTYEAIKEYVHNGDYMKEMRALGMVPIDEAGNFNDAVIRQWLDIKAQTVPAPAPSTPMTTIPTATYKEFEGGIDSYEKAMDVYRQGEGHPQFADAEKMIAEHFNGRQSEAK